MKLLERQDPVIIAAVPSQSLMPHKQERTCRASPQRLELEKDGVQLNAILRTVDDFTARWDSPKGLQFNFHDFCVYECAAYQLSRLLGMLQVPPVVRRKLTKDDFQNPKHFSKLKSQEGTIQAWVEDPFTDREPRRSPFSSRSIRPFDIHGSQ